MGINKVILVGNVGKDPVVQYVKENVPVARFTLATNESYRDRDGNRQVTTEWHNITVWRGLAKVVEQYVRKGTQLYVEGKISNRSYEKDGQIKYYTEIIVSNMEMLSRTSDNAYSTNKEASVTSNVHNTTSTTSTTATQSSIDSEEAQTFDESDDLPF